MQQIVNFIIRNKVFLLFLLLFSVSIGFTIQSHTYHKSKFINSANFLSGGVYNASNSISDYFDLKEQNKILQEENNRLKSILFNTEKGLDSTYIDSISFNGKYKFSTAQVIKNSYSQKNNVLTINKGTNDSIHLDLGVITSKGLLGIIDNTSADYATVLSILNTTSSISAQLKKTNHFGSLHWNGVSEKNIQLTEIPEVAPVAKGDTIITSGRSDIFPKGIPIGIVKDFKLDESENYYDIEVTLFNDMTNIEHVYIIENKDAKTIKKLIERANE
ncbi:rod shape-determining protein MreC [Pontimicrobium sp. MEBiC06410]